jgi:Zinc finger C-x8-C-x5-C-x3-H type (and similar)
MSMDSCGREGFEIKVDCRKFVKEEYTGTFGDDHLEGRAPVQGRRRGEKRLSKSYYFKKRISLYKTEICKSFEQSRICKYGSKCQFAHSADELREVERHPRYKTEPCRTYVERGECPYGKRCCFIHMESERVIRSAPSEMVEWDRPEDLEVEIQEIEMSGEKGVQCEEARITDEEYRALAMLKRYRAQSEKKRQWRSRIDMGSGIISIAQSHSNLWVDQERRLVFVGAGEEIRQVVGLGRAPGNVYLRG